VLIRIEAAGLCGTDVQIWNGTYIGRTGPIEPPLIAGHEFVGRVVTVGARVSGFGIGERVTSNAIEGCGTCYACLRGLDHQCHHWRHLGVTTHGGFAEYCAVPARTLFRVPEQLEARQAAILEPMAIAVRTLRNNPLEPGATVVVIGPGPFGLFLLQAALAAGAAKTVVIGLASDEMRLGTASRCGASEVVRADTTDPVTAVRALTEGVGADLVIEAAADSSAVPQALQMVRQGGTVIMAGSGYQGNPVRFEPWNVVRDEITIRGTEGFTQPDFLNALRLLSLGKLSVAPIVTHEMPLAHINDACELVERKQAIKIVLRPAA
jgi:L-iditol 2-dehydrogenase